MPDKSWKAFERRIASVLGGKRRGADYADQTGGKNDIIHDHWSTECKLLSKPTYGAILGACLQAERNAEAGQEPIAVVKKKHAPDDDALVVVRLKTFKEWRL